ncbi:MAG: glycosyltransferase family 4 protein [Treponemataceae bacterium]|nr:glycosyltransferase family 4 protein [Treponemataceae bacterium]
MKRILMLTNMYPSPSNPTYGIFVKQTYDWLCADYDVSLVKITKQKSFMRKVNAYFLFYVKSIFLGIFKNYDLLYAHFISHAALPVRIIKLFKPKLIVIGNIHGEDVFFGFKKFSRNRKRSKAFLKVSDYIISPSDYFKQRLASEYNYPQEKIILSPSGGVDVSLFKPMEQEMSKKTLNLDISKKYIGLASRLVPGKGCGLLVEAFSKLNDTGYCLVIAGNGSEEENLKKRVCELQISDRVVFMPLLPHEKLVCFYNSLDIFCFPSESVSESLGLVGLEAMACGVLCVVSNNGGIMSYAVDSRNSLVFEKSNCEDLRLKLQKAASLDSSKIQSLKSNARNTALDFASSKVKNEFLCFFRKVLSL